MVMLLAGFDPEGFVNRFVDYQLLTITLLKISR